ncbi:hypothetical protein pb186bvf_011338 [Paramecium bursaria]
MQSSYQSFLIIIQRMFILIEIHKKAIMIRGIIVISYYLTEKMQLHTNFFSFMADFYYMVIPSNSISIRFYLTRNDNFNLLILTQSKKSKKNLCKILKFQKYNLFILPKSHQMIKCRKQYY